jgi:hypothetical protein
MHTASVRSREGKSAGAHCFTRLSVVPAAVCHLNSNAKQAASYYMLRFGFEYIACEWHMLSCAQHLALTR